MKEYKYENIEKPKVPVKGTEKTQSAEDKRKTQIDIEISKMRNKFPEQVRELDTRALRIREGLQVLDKEMDDIEILRKQGVKEGRMVKKFMVSQDQRSFEELNEKRIKLAEELERVQSQLYGILETDPDMAEAYIKFNQERYDKLALLNPPDIQAN